MHVGRRENLSSILQAVLSFKRALAHEHISLQRTRVEVRLSPEIMEWLAQDELPYLGWWMVIASPLLELRIVPVGSDRLARWLLEHKVRPMIAHPERNKELMANLDKLYPFVDMGCYFQVTAASVIGEFGRAAQDVALRMLDHDWVTVLATDAHNLEYRAPRMTQAREFLAQRGMASLAERLTQTMPAKILGVQ
jgi:protein-tyrosine phosphatase